MVKQLWPVQVIYKPILVDDQDYDAVKSYKVNYLIEYRSLNRRFKKLLGIDERLHLDHINGDRNDYRRANLRGVTHRENCQNRPWNRKSE